MASPNPYHEETAEEAMEYVEITDADGNVIDMKNFESNPDFWDEGEEASEEKVGEGTGEEA